MKQNERGAILPCVVCRVMTRPQASSREDHPGTVARATSDTCGTCAARRQRGDIRATPEQKARIQQVLQDHTLKGLTNFMAARHQRQGVKQ